MPHKPLTSCRATGCRNLVPSGFCPDHAHLQQAASAAYDHGRRRYSKELAVAAEVRSSAQWQKVRRIHRAMYPLCCDPLGDHKGAPALNQQSHHIEPLASRPDLAFTLSNLAPLCARCHSRVEQEHRAGKPTRQLFALHLAREKPPAFLA